MPPPPVDLDTDLPIHSALLWLVVRSHPKT
jgi:hypothetical protein